MINPEFRCSSLLLVRIIFLIIVGVVVELCYGANVRSLKIQANSYEYEYEALDLLIT